MPLLLCNELRLLPDSNGSIYMVPQVLNSCGPKCPPCKLDFVYMYIER